MNSINLIFLLAMSTWATCTKISLPYDFTTVSSGTRATLQANFSEGATKSNNCFDSTDEVRGRMTGYSGDFTITSLDNLKLRLDVDGSLSGRFMVLNGATGDSLLRVQEDSTWKVWGPGEGTKLTLSDSILAATARISGLTASRLMATNAGSTLASVSDLTSWIAGTTNQITSTSDGDGSITLSIPNGFTLPSASPTFTGLTLSGNATVGGTLGVTGVSTFTAQPILSSLTASLPVFTNGSKGLVSNAMTGTGNVMMSASPTTTGTLTAAAANFSAKVVSSDTVAASLGFRAGSAGATDVSLYRSGSNMWTTPDSLTVGGNLTADSIIAPKFYQDTTFTLTAYTGMTTTPTGTAYATRIGRVVTLMIPYITGTSNGVAFFLSGIPTGWRPAQEQAFPISVYVDNSSTQYGAGSALVLASGIIVLQSGALTWTSSGTKAIGSSDYTNTITYMLQ